MSDSKGRPTAADIPDRVLLEAVRAFHDRTRGRSEMRTPDEALADRWPAKVVLAKMRKLADKGYIDCGVSLRTAWLEPKGAELLDGIKETA